MFMFMFMFMFLRFCFLFFPFFVIQAFAADSLDKSYFEKQVLPFLEQNCAGACHDNPAASFEQASRLVTAGKPDQSDLYRMALGEDSHAMSLEPSEAIVLRQWISGTTAKTAAPKREGSHPGASSFGNVRLGGRVDLTAEFTSGRFSELQLNKKHFLIFLNATASKKVSFQGEIGTLVNSSTTFYEMIYKPIPPVSLHFGRIMVPFGDNRRFHHSYGADWGKMFPLLWSAYGMKAKWKLLPTETVEAYVTQGFGTSGGNPNLQSSTSNDSVAVGTRWTSKILPKVTLIGSVLYQKWQREKSPLFILGGDLTTNYNLVKTPVLKNLRLGIGGAVAFISQAASGTYRKTGDYAQLYTNLLPLGELRLRYGTYVDSNKNKTAKDTHGFNVAWIVPVDALTLLVEYQWNFEAFNEVDNDLLRLMLTLSF